MSVLAGICALQVACGSGALGIVPEITLTFPGAYECDEFKRRLTHEVELNGKGNGAWRLLDGKLFIAGHPVLLRIEA